MTRIKMKPYVLKHGSPDMSCVVMTTCKWETQSYQSYAKSLLDWIR